jgi:hypothetical protein
MKDTMPLITYYVFPAVDEAKEMLVICGSTGYHSGFFKSNSSYLRVAAVARLLRQIRI